MKKVFYFLTSTKLTVALSVLIAANAALGSIVVIKNSQFFSALDSVTLIPWLVKNPEIRTAWIFSLIFLVSLFSVNTAVCTAERAYNVITGKSPLRSILPQAVHTGFLVALLGHLLASTAGFKTTATLVKGDKVFIKNSLSARLDGMEIKTDVSGEIDFLRTRLTVFEGEKEAASGDVMPNSPLIYRGVAFYHAGHGQTVTGVSLMVDGVALNARFGSVFSVKEKRFLLSTLYPDFALDSAGNPYSLSGEYRNPYGEIISEKGEKGYLPLASPGSSVSVGEALVTLAGYVAEPYVHIMANKDEGIWLVGAGSFVLVAAMAVILFTRKEKGELTFPSG